MFFRIKRKIIFIPPSLTKFNNLLVYSFLKSDGLVLSLTETSQKGVIHHYFVFNRNYL